MITLAPMTGFAFASRTTPCSAAFLEADWPGRRCCETDCCGRSAPAPEPNAGTAQNKLRSNHRRADLEINTRDASRIASDPGCPARSGAQKKLRNNHRRGDLELNTRDAARLASAPGCPANSGEKQLESSGDHSFLR